MLLEVSDQVVGQEPGRTANDEHPAGLAASPCGDRGVVLLPKIPQPTLLSSTSRRPKV